MSLRHLFCLVLAIGALVAGAAFAQGSRDTLERMQAAARDLPGVARAVIDLGENRLVVQFEDGSESFSYPGNLERVLAGIEDEAERQKAVVDFMQMALAAQKADDDMPDDALSRILPVLRSWNWVQSSPLSGAIVGLPEGNQAEILGSPFAGGVTLHYVLDSPEAMAYLSLERIETAGLSMAEIEQAAVTNMAARLSQVELYGGDLATDISMLVLDGYYESSLLLVPALWDHVEEVAGPVAVAIPARDLIVFAPLSQPKRIAALREIAAEYASTAAYPISDALFVRKDGAWTTLD